MRGQLEQPCTGIGALEFVPRPGPEIGQNGRHRAARVLVLVLVLPWLAARCYVVTR